ncbi:MAG: ABC transporter permease [Planctomycetota bacterium]
MSKTMIVAQREYLENLRTKTFWIGIFMLPVLFAVSIAVQKFLARNKDVRTYTVVDQTPEQWLSKAIEAEAARGDLESTLRTLVEKVAPAIERFRNREIDVTALGNALRDTGKELARNDVQRELFEKAAVAMAEVIGEAVGGGGGDRQKLLVDVTRRISQSGSLLDWFSKLTPQQLALLQGRLDRTRFRYEPVAKFAQGEDPEPALNEAINRGSLFAYFVLPADPVLSKAGARYYSGNVTDSDLKDWYEGTATELVRQKRVEALQLAKADAERLRESFTFEEKRVDASGKTSDVDKSEKANRFAPVAFVYLLWIAIFTAAQMLLTNTVEEKSNRLIEVLLSSVSPIELMTGKVLGIGATGLTMVVSWVITALVGIKLIPDGSPMASLDLAAIIGDPRYLTSFVAYFVSGYFLYAAILVGFGSVCNSLKEAQNLLQPIMLLLFVPLLAMVFVVQDPNGTIARVLTYIPFFTPFLMMNRAGGPPPAWEYVASSALILVSLVVAFWGAGKIFRVGILMTGKPPKLGEILRWLRAPIGAVHVQKTPSPQS